MIGQTARIKGSAVHNHAGTDGLVVVGNRDAARDSGQADWLRRSAEDGYGYGGAHRNKDRLG